MVTPGDSPNHAVSLSATGARVTTDVKREPSATESTSGQMTPSPDKRVDLVGMTHPELERFLTNLGKERYRATQVMKWIHQGLTESFESMTNLSKSFREELSVRACIEFPEVLRAHKTSPGRA